jgi:hypothetical protein
VKLTLNAGAADATTPIISEVRVQAAPVMEKKWVWNIMLEAFSQYSGKSKIDAIEALIDSQEVVVFEDLQGRRHNVMVDDAVIEQIPDSKYSAVMTVQLKEV